MTDRLDFQAYCFYLYRIGPRRVRLALFCVPGMASELARRLHRKYGALEKNSGCVVVNRPAHVAQLLSDLDAGREIVAAGWKYERVCRESRKGFRTEEVSRQKQAAAVAEILSLQPIISYKGTP